MRMASRSPVGFGAHSRRRVGALDLHVVEAGPPEGRPAILLHGFPEFWYGWRHQLGPLAAAGLRIVAPDQRGYNLSDKPQGLESYTLDRLAGDVVALADALGCDRVSLVGHDWGGLVAWWTAARHGERVERLAILNAPHPQAFGPYLRRHPTQLLRSAYIGFFQLPWLAEAALAAADFALLRRALAGSSRPGTFTAADLERYKRAWAEPGALTAMLAWYRALRLRRTAADADRIRCPTLVIWGRRDQALEPGLVAASTAFCDDARVIWHDEATHWVHHEEPAAVNEALTAFLAA
jgi:pimeloyl-ACP methyl ester carboxylesterase